jgi:hypothetical protein
MRLNPEIVFTDVESLLAAVSTDSHAYVSVSQERCIGDFRAGNHPGSVVESGCISGQFVFYGFFIDSQAAHPFWKYSFPKK